MGRPRHHGGDDGDAQTGGLPTPKEYGVGLGTCRDAGAYALHFYDDPNWLTQLFYCAILKHMLNQRARLDLLFQALADPTRRAMVERLSRGPASVSDLAQPLPSRCRRWSNTSRCSKPADWSAPRSS